MKDETSIAVLSQGPATHTDEAMFEHSASPQPRENAQNSLSLRDGSPLLTIPTTFPVSLGVPLVAVVPCIHDTAMEVDNVNQSMIVSQTRYHIDYIDIPNLPGGSTKMTM